MAYNLKEMTEMCSKWVAENGLMEHGGARLKDFCAHFGIDSQTYYRWLENADFADAIKKGKNEFKEKLEQRLVESLSKAACGYEFEETKTEYEGKKVKKKIVTVKNVEANVGAPDFITFLRHHIAHNDNQRVTSVSYTHLTLPTTERV